MCAPYATNYSGTVYGADVTFTSLPTAPTVTTQAVTDLTATTATGNGTVTDLGIPNPTDHGVVWSTSSNPTTSDTKTADGGLSGAGTFIGEHYRFDVRHAVPRARLRHQSGGHELWR